MKFLYVKRKTRTEKRYTAQMGMLTTKVIYVKKYIFGLPIKTLYKYRQTYYGQIKNCDDCLLFV
ncbi:hypothetical protein [Pareuzebyella sediminis]|uniref:hypothetical protein n=1 Tax=Pareuzebyella sediminis TaxID=2607998 RepID=UPI0011F01743|nr:hypothetical protein [Pareuzebyella sediminis]